MVKQAIEGAFTLFGTMFDKIPILNRFKGYRSVIGLLGLAVSAFCRANGYGDPTLLTTLEYGFAGFTALSLNAKGRE